MRVQIKRLYRERVCETFDYFILVNSIRSSFLAEII